MSSESRPALFLDRDGVLNVDKAYVARAQDFEWAPGAQDCVRQFNELGYLVFVVTNQTGIAFGLYDEADMRAVHDHMRRDLAAAGAHVDAIYACPFHPDASVARYRIDSDERKPHPGMLLRAMADYDVDKSRSFLIGDKQTDLDAAKAAGLPGFLFTGGNLCVFALHIMAQLSSAAL
ncbi:MAG: HAD family hydrolase [Caulobacterales bacterium]